MQGELPLSRNYAGVGRTPVAAGAGQLPRQQPLQRMPFARRSWLGVVLFAMLVAFCLFDMNTVAYNLLGVTQFFSNVILLLCVGLLLLYRLTVVRDLGPSGRIFVGFVAAFMMIGVPVGLGGDAASLVSRWAEIRLLLATTLIVCAAAVAARHILIAFGPRFTLRLLFALSLTIPVAVWVSSNYPDFYRVEVGQARDEARATGTFANPNEAAAAVCMVAAVIFGCMTFEKSKVFSVAGIAVCAYAIVLTGSRGGFVVFALLALSQIVISPGYRRVVLFLIGGSVVVLMLYAIYNIAMVSDTADRTTIRRFDALYRVAQGEVTDETTGGRFELAMNGLRAWAESPLLGNGLGSQRRVGAANIGPHNSYIRIGGEGGVLPLLLFLTMIASLYWFGWKCREPAVRTMVLGFAIVLTLICMTSHNVLASREQNVMLGIVFGLVAGCLEIQTFKSASPNRPVRRSIPQPVRRSATGTPPRPGLGAL